MITWCKNADTGKFHMITVLSWTEAEYNPEEHDEMPPGSCYGGMFQIADGTVKFLPPDAKELARTQKVKRRHSGRLSDL